MSDIDAQIRAALNAEDRELLEQLGEQGLFAQWFSVYRGPQAWISIMSTIVIVILFVGAVFAGQKFFTVGDEVSAVKWGALAFVLLTMVSFIKVWFWIRMEANRVLREIKRVELQVAQLIARHND